MRRFALLGLFLIVLTTPVWAALKFPALSGRVVDDAHILSMQTIQTLDQKLAAYENGTTNQVVVVTVPSLQGQTIENYGYQLGRAWGIGQKGKNNGVLLIVAPKDRKVRIEVGYGLEGTMTDAASATIVQSVILPQFRAGHMEQGIIDGTVAIINVLGGKSVAVYDNANGNADIGSLIMPLIFFLIFFGLRFWFIPLLFWGGGRRRAGFSGSGFSSGGFGGGFSGGGGSFGGGGASGGW